MNRQQRKRLVKEYVGSHRLSDLVDLARGDRRVAGVLCGLLFEQDDLFRWRAVEGLGAVAADIARTDLEPVRELLRRLEWLMNDESGGAGWHSPEAMAAIVLNVPELIDTFGVILGAHLNDEPLRGGAHWAVAAVSEVRPDIFTDKVDELKGSLSHPEPWVRGCAAIALASIAPDAMADATESLLHDPGELALYSRETGELRATTVGDVVRAKTTDAEAGGPDVSVW